MGRVTDTHSFIIEAARIHNNCYDYSLVNYIKSRIKVAIICKEHGIFYQIPNAHLCGQGCPECRKGCGPINRGLKISRKPIQDRELFRQCSMCGEWFGLDSFSKSNKVLDGYSSECRECQSLTLKKYRTKNADRLKLKIKLRSKDDWIKYKERHKEELAERRAERAKYLDKRKILNKMARKLRIRIREAILRKPKKDQLYGLLGCSIEDFKIYLESKFTDGMTWDNYGYWGWHIDHIIPCVAFDLEIDEEQKKCFHYTNCQPLWREDNQRKSGKYDKRLI